MNNNEINTFSKGESPDNTASSDIKVHPPVNSELLKKFKRNEKYEHLALVGKGGMGTITLSRDKNTLRKVAVKTLNEDLLKNYEAIIRFTEEAQITAQLEHPNIIPVYEMGLDENEAPFYTMKYVKGTNLKEILKLLKDRNEIILKKFHIIELLNIFVKVCDAMSFACSKGVLHRDLKPENIMIGEFGEVLIVDWGLAKTFTKSINVETDKEGFSEEKLLSQINSFIDSNIDTIRSMNNVSLSIDNCLIGTPQYMAPERIVGAGNEKSEIFALGTILYDILALSNMFTAVEVKEVLKKVASGDSAPLKDARKLPHISNGKVPTALIAVVEKACQSNPQERYESIAEFKSEIESYILGFATKAESAGFFKLLKLGLYRHKKVSFLVLSSLIAILSISSVFIYELVHSRQDALNKSNYASFLEETANRKSYQVSQKSKELQAKINELKSHTDIIIGNALHEADQLNFEKALNYINYAIDLNPDHDDIYWHQGRIYLTILSLDQAIESFKKIKKESRNYKLKNEFLEWSERLSAKIRQGTFGEDDIIGLYHFLKSKGEYSEAIAVLKELENHRDYDKFLTEIWKLRLERSQLKGVFELKGASIVANGGKFKISFQNVPLFDLSPMAKMPIKELEISNCRINNIDALKDMPLEVLSLNNTGVSSLKPVAGKSLIELKLRNHKIKDLSPLKGMPLRRLVLNNCPVEQLFPLTGMVSLEYLSIENSQVASLAPLRGMRLKYLNAQNTKVRNISPLKGMPLKTLILNSSQVNNLTVLKTIAPEILELNDTLVTHLPDINVSNLKRISISDSPVKNINTLKNAVLLSEISLSNTQVTNLSALQDKKLETVHMTGTPVSKISPVINKKLKNLYITGTLVDDFEVIKNAPNLEVLFANDCGISKISVLSGLPLKELDLSDNEQISSIEPLKGLKLLHLNLNKTSVTDISILHNQPIKDLSLQGTAISSLDVIPSLKKLKSLNIKDCKEIKSMKPLLLADKLETLMFYHSTPDAYLLKNHPSIQTLSVKGNLRLAKTFWQMYERNFLEKKN